MTHSARRRFLKSLACLGGAAATTPLWMSGLARALDAPAKTPRYFVFAYFSGAWDVLLSLDPRDPNVFTNAASATTRIQPGYEQLDDVTNDGSLVVAKNGAVFGPYIGRLASHSDKLCVVRGMSMDTLTHEVGRRRFLTGRPPSGLLARGSSAATWLAAQLGQSEVVPNLAIRVESYNVDQPNWASGLEVARVPDLVRAFRKAEPALDPTVDALIDGLLAERAACANAAGSPLWQAGESARIKAAEMTSAGYDALFDFQAKTESMAALRQHYGIAATGATALETPEAQAAAAATALTAGLSRVVSFQAAGGLDTHFDDWATDQGPTQQRGFAAVAALAEDLASREHPSGDGSSWLDHTTIVGFSEFSRTPLLNTRGGRDHHLGNSCFLLGGRVRPGIIGASTDVGMLPRPIDLGTGAVNEAGGEIPKPEHVLMGLFREAGVEGDPADLRVEPLAAAFKAA